MKNIILLCLGLGLATFSQAAEDRVFVLATAGDVDATLVDGVRNHIEKYTRASVRLGAPIPMEEGESLEAVGRAAAKTLGENDHSIIVLARPTEDQPQGICLPHERFAILNLSKLEVGADASHVQRRASQEALRVMSMLLDMSPCPFPLCVLVSYKNVEDLDTMSANYCPPCQDRFTRLARKAGIRLIEPAPEAPVVPVSIPEATEAPAEPAVVE